MASLYEDCSDFEPPSNSNFPPQTPSNMSNFDTCSNYETLEKEIIINCENHALVEARFYCEAHNAGICRECITSHQNNPCKTKDIDDEICDRKMRITDLIKLGKAIKEVWQEHDAKTRQEIRRVGLHLTQLENHIGNAVKEESQKVTAEREEMDVKVNKEAEEAIKKINDKKLEKLRRNHRETKKKREEIQSRAQNLNWKLNLLKKSYQNEYGEIKEQMENTSTPLDDALERAERLVFEGKDLFNNFTDIIRLLMNTQSAVKIESATKHVVSIAGRTRFVRVHGIEVGKIDVRVSKEWQRNGEVPTNLGYRSYLMGSVSGGEVVTKLAEDGSIHLTDLSTKSTRRVIENRKQYDIFMCVSLMDGRIACEAYDGKIVIYDSSWSYVRTIDMKREETNTLLSVNKDGMILAAIDGACAIHMYNPDDGKLIRTFAVHNGPIREMHALSNGDIALRVECEETACIVDSFGDIKSVTKFHGKYVLSIAVDRLTDSVYVMYREIEYGEYGIDVMSPAGVVSAKRIVAFKANADRLSPTCASPESGKIVIYYEGKLFEYENK